MKAFLMHADRDFDVKQDLPSNSEVLVQDLELGTLFEAMACGDEFLEDIARRAVLCSLSDPDSIAYRQRVLDDCLEHQAVVRRLYVIAVAALDDERKVYWGFHSQSPDLTLHRSLRVLELFVDELKQLRGIVDDHAAEFRSDGFAAFFAMLTRDLDDAYFDEVEGHLRQLKFRNGALISARLGSGNKGTDYVLRAPNATKPSWRERLSLRERSNFTLHIPDRDESGARALADLRNRGINQVANALAQATEHVLSFFRMLRAELGFYVCCLNLHARLTDKGEPLCMPTPLGAGEAGFSARELYDVCLALRTEERVVGNDLDAGDRRLVMITGANQGGKSTFLRSVGIAQLMLQCGMFVGAAALRADVRTGVFTHFKREEDETMRSGKFDEELGRMNEIAERMTPQSLVLFNESFAATNEREGSEIARQIVRALLAAGVEVFFVTHMFDLAHGFQREGGGAALLLRAERMVDGRRSFRIVEREPLPTSFGEDLYRRIFADQASVEPDRAGSAT